LSSKKIRAYVNYPAGIFHLKVHFTTLGALANGSDIERIHLLQDIIDNIQLKNDYYQTKTLYYKLSIDHPLYKLLEGDEKS
jgi:hypothetical protein